MRASVKEDTTTREITLEVSGVPDVDATMSWQTRPRWFRPDLVTITVVDGKTVKLEASGGLILKSGQSSTQVRESKSWGPDNVSFLYDKVSAAPGWVQRLWAEAPSGVTSWDDPGQPA